MSLLSCRRAVHGLLFALLVPTATACTTWQHHELAPEPTSGVAPRPTVRVTTRDGSKQTLCAAQLRGDTLYAALGKPPRNMQRAPVSVPIADMADVQACKFSLSKTIGLTAFSAAMVVLGVAALFEAAWSRDSVLGR